MRLNAIKTITIELLIFCSAVKSQKAFIRKSLKEKREI